MRTGRQIAVRAGLLAVAVGLVVLLVDRPWMKPDNSVPAVGASRLATLKLEVLRALGGHLQYCDPDFYPVAHGTPLDAANRRMPTIRRDAPTFNAILAFEGLTGARLSDEDLIRINEDYKQIPFIAVTGRDSPYRFSITVATRDPDGTQGGTIEAAGAVDVDGRVRVEERRDVKQRLDCPICLANTDLIDTPNGAVPVAEMRPGMAIWTTNRQGRRTAGVVLAIGRTPTIPGHLMIRLTLRDGRVVLVSPGHPMPSGRPVADLAVGELFDGSLVASVELVPYQGGATFDVLPSGPTGTYFVNDVLLRSSLASVE